MGHDQSKLSGLVLDKKAVEVTEFWNQYSATISGGNVVSIFIGEPLVDGSLWVSKTPLEKAAKNLMLYRHPCILKYISSWHKDSKFYLALEEVRPLSLVLASQNILQICVGLHSILKALCFLHETAHTSHNNVCISSIYVTCDGSWRLGGMEYLCRHVDITDDYLSKTRAYRYKNAVDPGEAKNEKTRCERPYLIDCYSYGTLVQQVLRHTSDSDSFLIDFLEFCKRELQNEDETLRPKLTTLLNHQFFTQDFIVVYSFLTELPLKDNKSKLEFFSTLIERLRGFGEDVVASQLGELLLSRMVLLDKTAQRELLPFVLSPRKREDVSANKLFSINNFQKYVVPRLLRIFCVRDAQIRILLLKYFEHYVNMFSIDELQSQILPELLVGIKDTNDYLVCVTLRALADIVPILGAATVIGGRRAKLFNDGRPMTYSSKGNAVQKIRTDPSTMPSPNDVHLDGHEDIVANRTIDLPERPSPDGEEGETSTEVEQSVEDDLDNWEDWEESNYSFSAQAAVLHQEDNVTTQSDCFRDESSLESVSSLVISSNSLTVGLKGKEDSYNGTALPTLQPKQLPSHVKRNNLPDILELDIKSQIGHLAKDGDDFDFFQDMEPVIESSKKYPLSLTKAERDDVTRCKMTEIKRLDLSVSKLDQPEEGWGDEFDWE